MSWIGSCAAGWICRPKPARLKQEAPHPMGGEKAMAAIGFHQACRFVHYVMAHGQVKTICQRDVKAMTRACAAGLCSACGNGNALHAAAFVSRTYWGRWQHGRRCLRVHVAQHSMSAY